MPFPTSLTVFQSTRIEPIFLVKKFSKVLVEIFNPNRPSVTIWQHTFFVNFYSDLPVAHILYHSFFLKNSLVPRLV